MASPLSLDGKVAYVTGSTRGIGRAIARAFAEHGATVIVNGRASRDTVDAIAGELTERHHRACLGILADQGDREAAAAAFRTIFSTFGRLDILVNNAGILDDAILGMIREASITSTFAVNALAVVRNTQSA